MSAMNLDSSTDTTVADSPPLIFGLDHECRSLCAQQYHDNLYTRFLVGTQSLEASANQVHLLEYAEEQNTLSKAVFRHRVGEIWHIASFAKSPNQLVTCYSTHCNLNKVENHCAIWRIPIDMSDSLREVDQQAVHDLVKECDFSQSSLEVDEVLRKIARIKPDEENELLLMLETKLAHVDLETRRTLGLISSENQSKHTNRVSKLSTFSWSPHFNGNVICLVSNNNIYSKDLRASNAQAWTIPQAHSQTVRDIDFNPNSQHYIASCGDDCEVKFWDLRNTSKPALKMLHHSHWLWSVRYNSFHDQLVLTASSDGNVNLLRASSVTSAPYGHITNEGLSDEEDANIVQMLQPTKQKKQADGLIVKFKDHEDSVYAIEWSPSDPWIFASLSYDGRFIINKVPESEKKSILVC